MRSHPAAEAYRMMTEEELAELAADIVANGLIDPIVTTEHEGEELIVDGRNRFKACERAGVKPRFEKLNGTDVRAFVAARGLRRNVSKGQQAIAYALLYPEPEKGGRGNKKKISETEGFSQARLSQARAIVNHSHELADAVRDGLAKFDEALKIVEDHRKSQNSAEKILERLKEKAPDLLELVLDERLTPREAAATLDQRIREAEDDKRVATSNLTTVVNMLHPRGGDPKLCAERSFAGADQRFWGGAPGALDYETLMDCVQVLIAAAEFWRK